MTTRMKVILVGVLLLVVTNRAVAADKTIALFNGRDLSGWTYHLDKPDAQDGGCVVGEGRHPSL